MSNPFHRLAPFIQDFIYREKWETLREIQVKAIETILDTPNHVLIMSGTASGKTEAAFLPILTDLYTHPSSTIGVLYIGPLKALINDQFYRLQRLLEHAMFPVQSWHGDVGQNKKVRFLQQAQGVLQITPESLEAMLINRSSELRRIFGDLRFVVIDEVHAFIGSDRGRQVLCQLQRLSRYQDRPARRIGLSATLGAPELAMDWLAGGTKIAVTQLTDTRTRREVQLGLEHFVYEPDQEENDDEGDQNSIDGQSATKTKASQYERVNPTPSEIASSSYDYEPMYHHIHKMVTSVKKTLIFANTRNDTEEVIQNLRRLSGSETSDEDSYYVHHGSISAALRERAEEEMRNPEKQTCVAATVTLELGIDLGSLDQVLQINATNSVSSFVQRLGRSGRRGEPAKMFFYTRESASDDKASLGKRIPWGLLQTIAIIQLYVEEKWVEPPEIANLPLSLLYHQTMSYICAQTELAPAALAENVLSLTPFSKITFDQYRYFLKHLIQTDHLEQMDSGGLIIGNSGERIVQNYRFYATFQDETSYLVREGTKEIGTVQSPPIVGNRFRLAGRSWEVTEVDDRRRIIQVDRVRGKAQAYWTGGKRNIHAKIVQRVKQVLGENSSYGYLQKQALLRLKSTRQLANEARMLHDRIVPLSSGRFLLLPWQGSKVIETIELLLSYGGVSVHSSNAPYCLEVSSPDLDTFLSQVEILVTRTPSPDQLIAGLPPQRFIRNKYDRYVPESLLQQAYIQDELDVASAVKSLREFVP